MFPADDEQRADFERPATARPRLGGRGVVTTLEPLGPWHPAEEADQDFFAKNPGQGYCTAVALARRSPRSASSFARWVLAS